MRCVLPLLGPELDQKGELTPAARCGDRVAVLADGRIMQCGPPRQALTAEIIAGQFGAQGRVLDDPD